MTFRDDLTGLCPPPAGRRREIAWPAVEAQMGGPLPVDYKWLAETYGPGAFDDFLWLNVPGCQNRNLDLRHQTTTALKALQVVAGPETAQALEGTGGPSSLVAWGRTDNGDVCYWSRRSVVLVNDGRAPQWCRFDGCIADFLTAVLSRREHCGIFPADFPSSAPQFTALEPGCPRH